MTTTTTPGANALMTVLTGLSGMGSVQIGVPATATKTVSAYVVAASQAVVKKAVGITNRDVRYNCTLVYRVDQAVSTAETTLMDLLDAFIDALNADLTLGGKCSGVEIDLSLADTPQYWVRSGLEFREYPVLVTLRQYGAFTPAP